MIKFHHLVIATSFLIAGCAAYFSVYGIGLLFSGATIAAMIMAGSLELGKFYKKIYRKTLCVKK